MKKKYYSPCGKIPKKGRIIYNTLCCGNCKETLKLGGQ
jgi:hypothetical protein